MNIKDFSISTDTQNAEFDLAITEESATSLVLKFTMKAEEKIVPSPVKVEWKVPVGNIVSVWGPLLGFSRFIAPNWRRTKVESKTAVGAPVLSLINNDGTSSCTIAISDTKTPTEIGAGVSEEEAVFFCNATFFTSYISPIDSYEAYIRIDFENQPFTDSVKRVNAWWENDFGYEKAYVPHEAYLPMNSAWYSFHQALDPERLIEECRISAKLGMKTIIIDDGWQTTDNNRGYRYCGDWELATEKIPDMKKLTDEIHKLGMKVMLWYSVPFVGIYSKAYERFKDMALADEKGVLVVDLRYKEVRDYLVETYVNAVKNFGLNGLKLDFIDRFKLRAESPEVNDRMDIPSIEDALESLLAETKAELVKIDPEILLEFRQGYIGPTVLKYGNMVRVGDCPYDSLRNRMHIINLRLTSGKTAVHSDMIMWHKNAPVEAAARQLISTLFGVPQVSVILKGLSEEHLDAIKFWLDFYTENIDVLHSENISVKNPELNFSQVRAEKDGRVIGVNYANVPFEVKRFAKNGERCIFINSADDAYICLNCAEDIGSCRLRICDCLGRTVSDKSLELSAGAIMLNVPVCGFVEISKN
ncbi:MAG: alpha-galactosidase [Clostridia bacterium]|nr:alpha-galactosidase [Clostridia bacterium]